MDTEFRQRFRKTLLEEEFSSASTPLSRSPRDWTAETSSSSSLKSRDEIGGEEGDEGFPVSSEGGSEDQPGNDNLRRSRSRSRRRSNISSLNSSSTSSSSSDTSMSRQGHKGRHRPTSNNSSDSDYEGPHRTHIGVPSGFDNTTGFSKQTSSTNQQKRFNHSSVSAGKHSSGSKENKKTSNPDYCRENEDEGRQPLSTSEIDAKHAKELLQDLLSIKLSLACELEDFFKELASGAKISISGIENPKVRKKLRHLFGVFHCKSTCVKDKKYRRNEVGASTRDKGPDSSCLVYYASHRCRGNTLRRLLRQLLREVASDMDISREAIKSARAKDEAVLNEAGLQKEQHTAVRDDSGYTVSLVFDDDGHPLSLTEMRARGLFEHVNLDTHKLNKLFKPSLPWGVSKVEQQLQTFRTQKENIKSLSAKLSSQAATSSTDDGAGEPWVRFNRDEVFGTSTRMPVISDGSANYHTAMFSSNCLESRFKASKQGL